VPGYARVSSRHIDWTASGCTLDRKPVVNGRAYARPLDATLGQWLIQPTQWAHTVHVASSWAESQYR
jgi:hypothetical protein